jgi:hypothetical protein
MPSDKQYGSPLIVDKSGKQNPQRLTRTRFEKGSDGFSERWLQELVSRNPHILPIDQIEPALTPAISICMELPLKSGSADILYATPRGDLIVGETKLFRNPEARREVVGQLIDYAKDLSALSYEDLDQAIRRAEAPAGNHEYPQMGLYETIAEAVPPEDMLAMEQFHDAVCRNLERGRFLLLVIGDGIHEGTEHIARFLQQHAGMHFTLSLIDLAIFELPDTTGSYLVQPRILARTKNIDRATVRIENGKITATLTVPDISDVAKRGAKATTITEEKFYEELGVHLPGTIEQLKGFVGKLDALDVKTDFGKTSMMLKWRAEDQSVWNLGTIQTNGKVWTEMINIPAEAAGLLKLSHGYLEQLATAIAGADVKQHIRPHSWFVRKNGTYVTIDELLKSEDAWLAAITSFVKAVSAALRDQ